MGPSWVLKQGCTDYSHSWSNFKSGVATSWYWSDPYDEVEKNLSSLIRNEICQFDDLVDFSGHAQLWLSVRKESNNKAHCTLEYQVFPILNIGEIVLMLYKPWLCVYDIKTVPTVMIVQ